MSLGALLGGLMGGPPGAALGALLGHGTEKQAPFALTEALQSAFAARNARLVELYRHGPFALEALFEHGGEYFSLFAQAQLRSDWQQVDLDDWLYGELLVQLNQWLQQYGLRLR